MQEGQTRKEQIIDTASQLFKQKGYSAVTMRDLASTLGIKAASLYNHISSKQELLKSIIISLAEEFTEGMQDIKGSEQTTINKLKAIVNLHVRITSKNTFGMASLNNDWMHLEDQLDYYLLLREAYEEDFRQIIQQGMSQNEIVNRDVEVMLFSILSTLRSLYLWIPKKEDMDIEELSQDLSATLIEGIQA